MKQEEKAKRYDEAIEEIQKYVKDDYGCIRLRPEDIFPELKESEDERMMNQLHSWMKEFGGAEEYTEKVYLWLKGLLEKQGEHAKFRDSIQVGDKLTLNEDGVLVNLTQLKRVAKQEKLTEFEKAVKQVMEEAIECGDTRNLKADAEMLLSLVHNSSWSEEDEKLLDKVIKRLHKYSAEDEEYLDKYYWLIELKHRVQPQNTWKPSDEQIKAVKEAACYSSVFSEKTIDNLIFLSKDLKKLKG